MRDWAKTAGIVLHQDVDFHHEFSTGRGCMSKEQIEENELLLLVPIKWCLGHDAHLGQSPFPTFSPVIQTALCLLSEDMKGSASEFYPYLRTLGWAVSSVDPKVNFDSLVLPFIKAATPLFPKEVTYEMFQRAMAFVLSRGFHLNGKGPFLVPFADSLNHHCATPHTKLEGNTDDELGFVMRTNKTLFSGEEVFNTYGNLASYQLLQTFGFVPHTDNPHDVFCFPSDVLKDATGATDERINVVKECGIPFPPTCTATDVKDLITHCYWLGPGKADEVVDGLTLDKKDGVTFVECARLALAVVMKAVDMINDTKASDDAVLALQAKERNILHNTKRTLTKILTGILLAQPPKRKRRCLNKRG
eukprot:GEMP01043083.1.p1 GENE.GEMP01043083.1~~GEMP01043083.1.p1  ORF type:complete len:361 (+),score=85.45 GEMP01043083.1:30-1112(+)